jgi:hypothetical protein
MYQTFYRPSYARKAQAVKTAQPAVSYSAETVWGAAAYAHRINGGYFKVDQFDVAQPGAMPTKRANKAVMTSALADATVITDADRALGSEARDFLAQQLTVKTLKDTLSDFDRSMASAVTMDELSSQDRLQLALIASQIRAYEQAKKEVATAQRIDHTLGYLADVGAKVQARVEVTRVVYSQNYGVYFISGITDTNQAVFFSYRERHDAGSWISIKGTVKAHRPDATQLSRVRVI